MWLVFGKYMACMVSGCKGSGVNMAYKQAECMTQVSVEVSRVLCVQLLSEL